MKHILIRKEQENEFRTVENLVGKPFGTSTVPAATNTCWFIVSGTVQSIFLNSAS